MNIYLGNIRWNSDKKPYKIVCVKSEFAPEPRESVTVDCVVLFSCTISNLGSSALIPVGARIKL